MNCLKITLKNDEFFKYFDMINLFAFRNLNDIFQTLSNILIHVFQYVIAFLKCVNYIDFFNFMILS